MARSTTTRSQAGLGHFFAKPQHADDAGFSLMESLVAFTIFIVVSVSAAFGLVQVIKLTSTTSAHVTATNLATQELERMRQQAYAGSAVDSYLSTDGAASVQTVKVGGTTYTVTPQLYPNPRHPGDPICASVPSSSATPSYTVSPTSTPTPTVTPTAPPTWERRVSVVVTWPGGNGTQSVQYNSVLAC
jgi:type II secretory pathway pseudopilin PulG